MAEKTKQHIIPVTYQKAFCDSSIPEGHPADIPFEPGIWIIDKCMENTPYRKAPKNVLWKNNFYTLKTDNSRDPVIEKWLKNSEDKYSNALRKLVNNLDITTNEWNDLLRFVGILHARTQRQVELWQRQFNEMEEMTRKVERFHSGLESYSDSQFVNWDEVGIRSIKDRSDSFTQVMALGAVYIIENQTEIPFVTSDTPTGLAHVFPDRLNSWCIPKTLFREDIDRSCRHFLCFCPLTPTLAVFASHALGQSGELRRFVTRDPKLVISLLWFLIGHADSVLLAHSPRPFSDAIVKLFQKLHCSGKAESETGSYVRLINPEITFTVKAFNVQVEHEGVFSKLRFRTNDFDQLKAAAHIGSFIECEYYADREQLKGFMRNVSFLSVAQSADEDSVMHQILKK